MGTYRRGDETWSIEQVGTRVEIVEGGVPRVEELASAQLARTRATVLTNQKAREGWRLVVAAAPPAPAPVPKAAVVENAREPALEAAILEAPDDDELWFVYGDWLMQQGDPRGQHIALRRAAHTDPPDPIAMERLRRFEAQHARYLRGEVESSRLGWGFLASADVVSSKACERLLTSDAARFLRRIEIRYKSDKARDQVFAVLERHAPSTLHELVMIGDRVVASLAAMPRVVSRLRVLELPCGAAPEVFGELARATSLETLGLGNALELRDSLDIAALAASDVAPRLRRLVLGLDDTDDALVLLAHLPRFARLEQLALVLDDIDPEVAAQLEAAVPQVDKAPRRYAPITE